MSLTVVITTKNSEKVVARAVRSAKFADNVIVIDDFSSDRTKEIATAAGARVIESRWAGYGPQKNVGLTAASSDWVFFLDADEEITSSLQHEVVHVLKADPQYNVYWVRVLDIFLGRQLRHLTGNNPRLLRKGHAQWTLRPVHEQVELLQTEGETIVHLGDTNSGSLQSFLMHHSHTTVESYLKKMHTYTSLDAKQMADTGRHRSGRIVQPSLLLPFQLATRQFIKLLLYRGGLRDGYAGVMWALLSGYYEWEMTKKYLNFKAVK